MEYLTSKTRKTQKLRQQHIYEKIIYFYVVEMVRLQVQRLHENAKRCSHLVKQKVYSSSNTGQITVQKLDFKTPSKSTSVYNEQANQFLESRPRRRDASLDKWLMDEADVAENIYQHIA